MGRVEIVTVLAGIMSTDIGPRRKTMPDTTVSQGAWTAPDPNSSIVTVATVLSLVEADMIREELQAIGIQSWASNATAAQILTVIQETGITIDVLDTDAERARAYIEELLKGDESAEAESEELEEEEEA
jgi:hypothetical protein